MNTKVSIIILNWNGRKGVDDECLGDERRVMGDEHGVIYYPHLFVSIASGYIIPYCLSSKITGR
jgi:hypothetical protein